MPVGLIRNYRPVEKSGQGTDKIEKEIGKKSEDRLNDETIKTAQDHEGIKEIKKRESGGRRGNYNNKDIVLNIK